MIHVEHPAAVRLLLAGVDLCRRLLCTCGLHAWTPSRYLSSTLEVCKRPGCDEVRDARWRTK